MDIAPFLAIFQTNFNLADDVRLFYFR